MTDQTNEHDRRIVQPPAGHRGHAVTGMAVDRRVRHTPAGDPWLI